MVIDFRKNKAAPIPVEINRVAVERVETYKYLGTFLDNDLKWKVNIDSILKKAHARLCCLRNLRSFMSALSMYMQFFYTATISSVLTIILWSDWSGGNVTKKIVPN